VQLCDLTTQFLKLSEISTCCRTTGAIMNLELINILLSNCRVCRAVATVSVHFVCIFDQNEENASCACY
jgi:hypothetical protein